jgi:hypothetical protein
VESESLPSGVLRLALSSLLATTILSAPSHAVATASSSPPVLMIKVNDLAELPAKFDDSWEIIGCGITALVGWTLPPISGTPATGPCAIGNDQIFTSYATFKTAISKKSVTSGSTVIFDPEKWIYTPKYEVADQAKYDALAGELAQESDIRVIYTPEDTTRAKLNADFRAAAKYASVIEIQSQYFQSTPSNFEKQIQFDLSIIRGINETVPVLAGLATDPGGVPASLKDMIKSYRDVAPLVQGFQLNLAVWRAPYGKGCARTGCVNTGVTFLTDELVT